MRNILLFASGSLLATACNSGIENTLEKAPNSPPVANAGDNITQTADLPVQLNGAGSYDPDGDDIILHWGFDTAPEGSIYGSDSWTLVNNNTVAPTTTFIPDGPGTYVVSLWVEDANGLASATDYAIVTITDGAVPIADAGPELAGAVGDLLTLDGTRSFDPYSRDLTYQWSFASVPSMSSVSTVDNPTASVTTFIPDVGGVYVAALVVSNGVATSIPDTAIIRVTSDVPTAPTAVTGSPLAVEDCTLATVDGSGSFDPNGETLTYNWTVISAPAQSNATSANFADPSAAVTTFFPDVAGDYLLGLAVYDGHAWSDVAMQEVTATERSYNSPPNVTLATVDPIDGGTAECKETGYTYSCDECAPQTITLGKDAAVFDPDGDALSYHWEALSDDAEISDPNALETEAELTNAEPTEPGACEDVSYEFQLTVTDCVGEVTTSIVTYVVTCCGVEESTGTTP